MGFLTVFTTAAIVFCVGLSIGNKYGLQGVALILRDYLKVVVMVPILMILLSIFRGDLIVILAGAALLAVLAALLIAGAEAVEESDEAAAETEIALDPDDQPPSF